MNKKLLFFVGGLCMVAMPTMAAVSIKKAAPVVAQQVDKMDSATSLVGTAMALVAGVKDLNAKVNALSAECEPTSAEINFVNDIIKEWAKTGAASAEDVQRSLKRKACPVSSGVGGYQASVKIAMGTGKVSDLCYDTFRGDGNDGMVWENFPRVGVATYCDDDTNTCGVKNQKKMSDIYEIFALVDFTEADYTKQEATTAAKIIAKMEKCSSVKLSQSKKELWGGFLTETVGNMGQKTSTASIMDTVGGMVSGGGGAMGGLSSIGSFISNTMNK